LITIWGRKVSRQKTEGRSVASPFSFYHLSSVI
jgi:hypothetical protein